MPKRKQKIGTRVPFHTGLHTSDWHRYPMPPYRGRGWTIDFVEPKSEFPLGGEHAGEHFYPFKEVILSARSQSAAQRALDTIVSAIHLLEGSNKFGALSSSPQIVTPITGPTAAIKKDQHFTPARIYRWPA